MINFFIDDEFFSDLGDYMCRRDIDEENIPDDYSEMANESTLEKAMIFDNEWLMDRLDKERDDEDGNTFEKIANLFDQHIDFDAINAKMPSLFWANNNKFEITKEDMLEYCKPPQTKKGDQP